MDTFRWQYYMYIIQSSDILTLEIGSLCPRSLSPELARRGSVSMPMFQSHTSPLNVPPAIRAGWLGWNATHIKQLCKVCVHVKITHLINVTMYFLYSYLILWIQSRGNIREANCSIPASVILFIIICSKYKKSQILHLMKSRLWFIKDKINRPVFWGLQLNGLHCSNQ